VIAIVALSLAAGATEGRARAQAVARAGAPASFAEVARRAAESRDAGRTAEAVRLYREAVALRPRWDEGWWHLGALLHQSEEYLEGREAMRRFVGLKPESGPGRALLGLCEEGAGDRDAATKSLAKGLFELGMPAGELKEVALWHLAALYVKQGEFERAHDPLKWLARGLPPSPGLEDTIGLALLRSPLAASEIPDSRRQLVRETGRAGYHHLAGRVDEARKAYEELIRSYPREPWVHYAFGASLKQGNPARALEEFRREIEIQPDNVYAHLEIAYLLLQRADYEESRAVATRAVELAPALFAGHLALGRALLGQENAGGAVRALEAAARLAPEVAEVQVTLAQAYAEAGRPADAARARARAGELRARAAVKARP
jgi:tetratricopeptide (TPR) repeat protein